MIILKKKNLVLLWHLPIVTLKKVRQEKDATILLDNGDNLQGQPVVYYYNFIDTVSPHFLSQVYELYEYDAGTVGNHDIETGHSVYDRW